MSRLCSKVYNKMKIPPIFDFVSCSRIVYSTVRPNILLSLPTLAGPSEFHLPTFQRRITLYKLVRGDFVYFNSTH